MKRKSKGLNGTLCIYILFLKIVVGFAAHNPTIVLVFTNPNYMETMLTLEVKAKLSAREVVNHFLMIPIERRLPMVERIIKMKTIGDYKFFLKQSITNLTKSELSRDDIGIILTEIREFEKHLHKKANELRKKE